MIKIWRGKITKDNQMHSFCLTVLLIKTLKVKNEKLLHVSIPVGWSSESTHIGKLCIKIRGAFKL